MTLLSMGQRSQKDKQLLHSWQIIKYSVIHCTLYHVLAEIHIYHNEQIFTPSPNTNRPSASVLLISTVLKQDSGSLHTKHLSTVEGIIHTQSQNFALLFSSFHLT